MTSVDGRGSVEVAHIATFQVPVSSPLFVFVVAGAVLNFATGDGLKKAQGKHHSERGIINVIVVYRQREEEHRGI
jgi:hypothetical protein